MTIITPGIDFLVPYLVKLSIPPLLFTLVAKYLVLPIPRWIILFAYILCIPLVSAVTIIWKNANNRRAAAAHGARQMPVFEGELIGNLDIMTSMIKHFEFGYPGTYSFVSIVVMGLT